MCCTGDDQFPSRCRLCERRSLPLLADSHPIGNQMEAGTEHPGYVHPASRRMTARRIAVGRVRVVRATSSGSPREPSTIGIIPASRASRRVVSALIGPPKASWAMPIRPCSTGRLMVSTSWGRFPLSVGSCPSLSARAARSMRASASGCGAVRRSIAVLVLGVGCGPGAQRAAEDFGGFPVESSG
jgi:hypothetical protein